MLSNLICNIIFKEQSYLENLDFLKNSWNKYKNKHLSNAVTFYIMLFSFLFTFFENLRLIAGTIQKTRE